MLSGLLELALRPLDELHGFLLVIHQSILLLFELIHVRVQRRDLVMSVWSHPAS